jgi:hypothetical protein
MICPWLDSVITAAERLSGLGSAVLGLFLGRVSETRESAFAGQRGHDVEEALTTIERCVAFDLPKGLRALGARVAPSAGDLRQMGSRVLDINDGQSGGGEQAFVLVGRHE